MIFDVKSGNVPIGDEGMDYISFGSGAETLVLIPGLGDGLSTVKGKGTALARQNETIREAVGAWIDMAEKGDYKSLMIDTAERTYSEKYLRKLRLMYPILTRAGKPESFDRFLIQARSCAGHDAYNEFGKISCPTFVIGGDSDKTVGPESSAELAKAISGSRLYVYKGLGHSAYEEAKDFNDRVLEFLKE